MRFRIALVILALAPPIAMAAPTPCADARAALLDAFHQPGVGLGALAPALGDLVAACSTDAPAPDASAEDLARATALPETPDAVRAVVAEATSCAGSVNVRTGALPATFTIAIGVAGQRLTFADVGTAVVATTGGSSQEAVFHGDGIYAGVLSNAPGTFRFPKLAHTLLPGTDGAASVHCIGGVLAGGSGWASLLSGDVEVTVHGKTIA